MRIVETIGRIRREHFVRGKSIREIARELKLSRNKVHKAFSYERRVQPRGRSSDDGRRSSIGF